jgi:hypothetical protein
MAFLKEKTPKKEYILPPFSKGGPGGINRRLVIPLNPPLKKGDFKSAFSRVGQNNCHTNNEG